MKTYALDSNIVSYGLKGMYGIREKLVDVCRNGNDIVVPPITYYEIMRGIKSQNAGKRLIDFNRSFLPYLEDTMTARDWLVAADIYTDCTRRGHPVAEGDLLQAAFCIRHNYILVTHNTKHFQHIAGLAIEEWVT